MEQELAEVCFLEHQSHALDATLEQDIAKNAMELELTTEKENDAKDVRPEKDLIIKVVVAQILTDLYQLVFILILKVRIKNYYNNTLSYYNV